MDKDYFYNKIENIFNQSQEIKIKDKDSIVIFSDAHFGKGDRNDDFKKNADLFYYVLKNYYLKNKYKLILNGDIEELQRFNLPDILNKWNNIYNLLDIYNNKNNLIKIVGNHDYELLNNIYNPNKYKLNESVKLKYKNNNIFIFHGHQASIFLEKLNSFVGFVLKYIANIFGISNYSVPYYSKKRMKIEQKIYDFSKNNQIISIIGHTHRPLFESLSKVDYLKFKIEELCRNYIHANNKQKQKIDIEIDQYKNDLMNITKKDLKKNLTSSLYSSNILLPCLFNSGCCIGKRGITSIEISKGVISLVQWFDKKINKKNINFENNHYEKLDDSDYYKYVLNQNKIDYIFSRIKLLS